MPSCYFAMRGSCVIFGARWLQSEWETVQIPQWGRGWLMNVVNCGNLLFQLQVVMKAARWSCLSRFPPLWILSALAGSSILTLLFVVVTNWSWQGTGQSCWNYCLEKAETPTSICIKYLGRNVWYWFENINLCLDQFRDLFLPKL